jgi:tetratricopeptide (TPR) repeat protein
MPIGNTSSGVRGAALAVFFLLFISPASLSAQTKEMPVTASKEALALFLQGRAKIDNLEDPGTLFDQAIENDPDFAMAYLFAGRTNQEFARNLEKAVSLADKVSPGEREWILAARDQAEGDAAGRKGHLDRLVALHPKDPRAHEQVGNYYNSIGDNATALKHFTAAVKLDKGYAPAYNNIGYMNMALGRYSDAERAFKTYIKLVPKNPNPYDSYAELLMKTGKYDESIRQYNRALAVDPTFFNSYRGIGNDYAYKGDYAMARESYRRMYDGAPDDAGRDLALVSEMNSYVTEGKTTEALGANERRRELAEKAGDVQSLIGVHTAAGLILLEAGKLDDATQQFERADQLRADPSLPASGKENRRFGSMQSRARLLIARQEFGPARAQLEEIRQYLSPRKNPNQERAYNQTAGFLELGQKEYARALEYFAKADPNDPYVWYYRAVASEGAGDKKGAAALYRKVADWNQLDATGHAVVRSRAVARGVELAKLSK